MPNCSSKLNCCYGLRLMQSCSLMHCCCGLHLMPSCSSKLNCCYGLRLMPNCSSMLNCCCGLLLMPSCFLILHCCYGLHCLLRHFWQSCLDVILRQILLQNVCFPRSRCLLCGYSPRVRVHIRSLLLVLLHSYYNSSRFSSCGFLRVCVCLYFSIRRGGGEHNRNPTGGMLRGRVRGYSVLHSNCAKSVCDSVLHYNCDSIRVRCSRSSYGHCSVHRYAFPNYFLPYR